MRPNPTKLSGWEVLILCVAFVLMCFTVDGENGIPPAAAETPVYQMRSVCLAAIERAASVGDSFDCGEVAAAEKDVR